MGGLPLTARDGIIRKAMGLRVGLDARKELLQKRRMMEVA